MFVVPSTGVHPLACGRVGLTGPDRAFVSSSLRLWEADSLRGRVSECIYNQGSYCEHAP